MSEVKHDDNPKNGVFRLSEEGVEAGLMTYTWAGDTRFIIDHTEIYPQYEGKGYGKQLVSAAVEFAREKQVRIVPLCPFAKLIFAKNPKFRDVL